MMENVLYFDAMEMKLRFEVCETDKE